MVQQQQIIQLRDQHNQQHQELMSQEGGSTGRQSLPSESSTATDLIGTVRSNAQNVANAVQADVEINAQ